MCASCSWCTRLAATRKSALTSGLGRRFRREGAATSLFPSHLVCPRSRSPSLRVRKVAPSVPPPPLSLSLSLSLSLWLSVPFPTTRSPVPSPSYVRCFPRDVNRSDIECAFNADIFGFLDFVSSRDQRDTTGDVITDGLDVSKCVVQRTRRLS